MSEDKETRILPEASKSAEYTPFSWGMRIVDKGAWWYFTFYAGVVLLYWFDFFRFLNRQLDHSDGVLLISLAYIAILIALPGYLLHRYRRAKTPQHD